MLNEDLEVANTVGTGDLGVELDLNELSRSLETPSVNHNPNQSSLHVRFEENGPLCMIYRSGKYIIRGGNKREYLWDAQQDLLSFVSQIDIVHDNEVYFEECNTVCVGDLGTRCNLNELVVEFGLENAEFEPEQFPGLFYHPREYSCVVIIFNSGKVVITGLAEDEAINEVFKHIRSIVLD